MLYRIVTSMLLLSALPAMSPAAEIPVVGQVLGPGGEPRAGADVRLERMPPVYQQARLRLAGRTGPEPAARTHTGADGTFELAAPEAGVFKVVASSAGTLAMEHFLWQLVDAASLPEVELPPATEVELRLVDAERRPCPGRVGASAGTRGSYAGQWRPQERLAAAGEDGIARLPVGRGEEIRLEARCDGHPLWTMNFAAGALESPFTIRAPRGGVARTVRITGQDQRPLAEAVAMQGLLPIGLSDRQGVLPLVLRKTGLRTVRVKTADRWSGSFELDPDAAGGEIEDLPLEPPVAVRGRVVDRSNRDPVAGALVLGPGRELAVSDREGRYRLELTGGWRSRSVSAAAAGYLTTYGGLPEDASFEVETIALPPAAAVGGSVVGQDGGPLGGVALEIRLRTPSWHLPAPIRNWAHGGWRGRTTSRGAFRAAGLPAGIDLRLVLELGGFAPQVLDLEALEPFEDRSGLEVVLRPGHRAGGRVIDRDQVPVAGAEIRLQAPPDDDRRAARRRSGGAAAEPHITGETGRFELTGVAAGRYDLEVWAAGHVPATVAGVRVTEGESVTDFGTVVLDPGASIAGRVTDPGGGAIAGAEVTADPYPPDYGGPRRPRQRAVTDAEGRFAVAGLPPGRPVTLLVTRKGYADGGARDLTPPSGEPLAVVLRPAGSLKGRVVDRRGAPIRRATVSADRDRRVPQPPRTAPVGRRASVSFTGSDGRFLIEDVEPGTLKVTVEAKGYPRQMRQGIELAPGAELELDFVLAAGAVVEGTVTSADGKPVTGATVVLAARDRSEPRITVRGETDGDGRYRLAGAPIGPAVIKVEAGGHPRRMMTGEVDPGSNRVDVVLERGFEVAGKVLAPDGSPVEGADVWIQQLRSFRSQRTVSAASGAFALSGVGAGTYKVTASREGYVAAHSEDFEVSGDVAGLRLELGRGAVLGGRVLGLEAGELGSLELTAVNRDDGTSREGVHSSGAYTFEHLAPGRWLVVAWVAGSGRAARVEVEVPEGVAEVERDIEIGAGFTLTGVVIDGGEPVAGAEVAATTFPGGTMKATTGAGGRFRIEKLTAGPYQIMVVTAAGVRHPELLDLAADHDLRIDLSAGALSGIVRDAASGEPVARADVALELLPLGSDLRGSWRGSFPGRAKCDSRGYFQIPRVRPGSWRAVATRDGYGPAEATFAVTGGSKAEIEIRMTPTKGVSFEVALESGEELSSVFVALLDPASSRRLAGGSHPVIDGWVRVSTVPEGRWQLAVKSLHSAAIRFAVTSPGDQGRLVLPRGGELRIRVPALEQVPIARVTLTGADGEPFVSPFTPASWGPGGRLMREGQAMVSGLASGVWSFTVEHDGRAWSGQATVKPGETTEVSLLENTVVGRVLGPGGEPRPRADVRRSPIPPFYGETIEVSRHENISVAGRGAAGDEIVDLRLEPPVAVHGRVVDRSSREPVPGALVLASGGELAVSDEEGRYRLDLPAADESRSVTAAAAGYLTSSGRLGEETSGELETIVLAPAAALGGRILDLDGGPLGGVAFELRPASRSWHLPAAVRRAHGDWRGRTNRRGAFRTTGVPAGIDLHLELMLEGFAPQILDVEALEPFEDRSGLEVVLRPGGSPAASIR